MIRICVLSSSPFAEPFGRSLDELLAEPLDVSLDVSLDGPLVEPLDVSLDGPSKEMSYEAPEDTPEGTLEETPEDTLEETPGFSVSDARSPEETGGLSDLGGFISPNGASPSSKAGGGRSLPEAAG